jgi:hypothetical protein
MYGSIRKACPNCSCTTCIKHPKTTEEGGGIEIPSLPPIPTTYGKQPFGGDCGTRHQKYDEFENRRFHWHSRKCTTRVSLGNQPEQRGGNKLMASNSWAHTTWRVAGGHVKLHHVLPACKECLDWMEYASVGVRNNWQGTSKKCAICTNWMIGGMDSPLLAFSPSGTFPKGYLLGGQWSRSNGTKVYPIELTYDTLKRAAMLTLQKLLSGEWSPTVAKSHLKERKRHQRRLKESNSPTMWQPPHF